MRNIILIGVATIVSILAAILSFADAPTDAKGKIVLSTQNEILVTNLDLRISKVTEWKKILEGKDEYRYPAWSPDGKQIVMGYRSAEDVKAAIMGANVPYNLALIDADGRDLRLLFKNVENYEYPSWSPDGKLIAFVTYPNWPKKRIGRICVADLSTKKVREIEDSTANIARPNWSFDGQLLTYASTDFALVVYNVMTKQARKLSEVGISPLFHPDGKRIFFVQKGNNALCSINIDGSSDRQVVKKDFYDYLVKFSKDGRYLLYAGGGAKMISAGYEYSALELLDMLKLKRYQIFKGSILNGASWIE